MRPERIIATLKNFQDVITNDMKKITRWITYYKILHYALSCPILLLHSTGILISALNIELGMKELIITSLALNFTLSLFTSLSGFINPFNKMTVLLNVNKLLESHFNDLSVDINELSVNGLISDLERGGQDYSDRSDEENKHMYQHFMVLATRHVMKKSLIASMSPIGLNCAMDIVQQP